MTTVTPDIQAVQKEVVKIIASITKIKRDRLVEIRDLTALGLDILDVVEIILKVEETYKLIIPDEVPVYSVDDFVNFIHNHSLKQAV